MVVALKWHNIYVDNITFDTAIAAYLLEYNLKDDVANVRFTNKLEEEPVCLSSQGNVSIEMEKVLNAMPVFIG